MYFNCSWLWRYFPRTFLGRVGIFFVSIWGVTIVSLVIVALLNLLSMDSVEDKVLFEIAPLMSNQRAGLLDNQTIKTEKTNGKFIGSCVDKFHEGKN